MASATSAVAAGIPTIGDLQFVQPAERPARRAALERAGVASIVTSWNEVLDLLQNSAGLQDMNPSRTRKVASPC